MAAAHHERQGRDRAADRPVVHRLAGGLDAGAEKGVGRAADQEMLAFRELKHDGAIRRRQGKGFLAVGVLAGVEGGGVHLGVGLGHGKVDDNLHFRIMEQVGHAGAGPDAILGGLGLGPRGIKVGAGDEIEDVEFLRAGEVGVADVAAADDANINFAEHIGRQQNGDRGPGVKHRSDAAVS